MVFLLKFGKCIILNYYKKYFSFYRDEKKLFCKVLLTFSKISLLPKQVLMNFCNGEKVRPIDWKDCQTGFKNLLIGDFLLCIFQKNPFRDFKILLQNLPHQPCVQFRRIFVVIFQISNPPDQSAHYDFFESKHLSRQAFQKIHYNNHHDTASQ